MLRRFQEFKAAKVAEAAWREESLFSEGFATPSRQPGGRGRAPSSEYVSWDEVQQFLQMAEQALKVRSATNEALSQKLKEARSEKVEVEKTSSAAREESSFLAESMQGLLEERAQLREALEAERRDRAALRAENELLRGELLEGAALGEEGSAALQLLARQGEELREVQQRNAQLENENVQLQARVSALEKAATAQATAMLSCLEESERVRLQQLTISVCESPMGPLAARRLKSEVTDDDGGSAGGGASTSYADALELGSDGSFVSCVTPLTTGSGGHSGSGGSIFRSCSPEPSPQQRQQWRQQQQQQQQQEVQSTRQPSEPASGGGEAAAAGSRA